MLSTQWSLQDGGRRMAAASTTRISSSEPPAAAGAQAAWHPCPTEPGCIHCGSRQGASPQRGWDWFFVEAAYCISLESRPDRAAVAAAQLHRLGLCRKAILHRPSLHHTPKIGIWEAHRAIAVH